MPSVTWNEFGEIEVSVHAKATTPLRLMLDSRYESMSLVPSAG